MVLATAIFAMPALAATSSDTTTSTSTSPAAANPAAPAHPPGMAATTTDRTTTTTTTTRPGAAATADNSADHSAPKYTTTDGQMRVGKIVGASVYNDQNQSVGSIDEVLMSHDNKATTAVISVGGFLGMGSKLVSVPFDQLKVEGNKIVMPGATKASLEGMPEYKYKA